MPIPSTCLRCGDSLEPGFVVDHGDYQVPDTQKWVGGPPVRTFWSGLKVDDKASLPVTTYRCRKCGWLESYATAG